MKKSHLKKELNKLFKSLDFISENYLNGKSRKKDVDQFFTIYQQLGIAWEFLGLQCKHWDGYKRTREGNEVCKICGKVKSVDESYYLIPKKGAKKIGFKVVPKSKKTFPTKKKATLLNDTVNFHGAVLSVEATNSYKSSLLGKKHEITVAADRIVTLKERGIECRIDNYLINVKVQKPKKKKPPYGGFPWEIKKKDLKNFPVIFKFDDDYNFLGLTILK